MRKTIKSLETKIKELNEAVRTSRELNEVFRRENQQLKSIIEKIKVDTLHKERQDLAKSYGQLNPSVATGLRTILSPNSF